MYCCLKKSSLINQKAAGESAAVAWMGATGHLCTDDDDGGDDGGDGGGDGDDGGDGDSDDDGDGDDGVIFYLLPMFASMADATRQRGPFSHQMDL